MNIQINHVQLYTPSVFEIEYYNYKINVLGFKIIMIDRWYCSDAIWRGLSYCSQAQSWVTYTSHWTSAMAGPSDRWLTRGCAWLCSSHNGLINQAFQLMSTNTSCIGNFGVMLCFSSMSYIFEVMRKYLSWDFVHKSYWWLRLLEKMHSQGEVKWSLWLL